MDLVGQAEAEPLAGAAAEMKVKRLKRSRKMARLYINSFGFHEPWRSVSHSHRICTHVHPTSHSSHLSPPPLHLNHTHIHLAHCRDLNARNTRVPAATCICRL